jgi:hypothetical protein
VKEAEERQKFTAFISIVTIIGELETDARVSWQANARADLKSLR